MQVILEADEQASSPRWRLLAPGVGRFVDPAAASLRRAGGDRLGDLVVLGRRRELVLPEGAAGRIAEPLPTGTTVAYGDTLAWLESAAEAATGEGPGGTPATPEPSARGAAVTAPSSGRYYRRPGPEKPAFVELGARVEAGQTVGLLEVMKTFTRIHYGGAGLPERAVVVELVAEDGAEVEEGAVLLRVEAERGENP